MPKNTPLKKKEFDVKPSTSDGKIVNEVPVISTDKKTEDFQDLVNNYSSKTEYKPLEYYHCGDTFLEATGLPGPAKGHITSFMGHSDTGKTAALIKSIMAAQKCGDLPVIIITEEKWSFEHAQLMGMDCHKDEDGQWRGFFIFKDDFDYVEQLTDYINLLLDKQAKDEIPYNLAFFWDSIGTIPCKLTWDGKGGKMHTAGVLSEKIGMGLNRRITSSRKATKKYINTLVLIVQPWVWTDMNNPNVKPKMEGKGGKASYLNSTLIFRFGNIENAGISSVSAQKDKRKIKFATRTKVSVIKNHINGLGFEDGYIIVTPHDFIPATDSAIDSYKKKYREYWNTILGTEGEFEVIDEDATAKTKADKDLSNVIKKQQDDNSSKD